MGLLHNSQRKLKSMLKAMTLRHNNRFLEKNKDNVNKYFKKNMEKDV